jgi:hypothetical protein
MLMHSFKVLILALAVIVGALTPTGLAGPTEDSRHSSSGATVITDWNVIAERTIFTENSTPIPASNLYLGLVSVAVFDAVVAIKGGFEPYTPQPAAHRRASTRVAAATAAYIVLQYYFPTSADALQNDYLETLSGERRNSKALARGVAAGTAAATSLLRSRQNDGVGAPITFDVPPAPGVWRPTTPGTSFAVPWLGFVKPLALESQTQFDLPDPQPLESEAYAADFEETKNYGAATDSKRTEEQTAIATFFSANVVSQYQAAMRDQIDRRDLDIVDSARAFALLNTAAADTAISCWRAKYDHPTWRPITAIREADTDGNEATVADPDWTPLGMTPPYSEFSSGHACVTGASSNTFSYLFGAETLDLTLPSLTDPPTASRHYDSADQLDEDAINARVWLGIHFRSSMGFANQLGHDVSDWTIANFFQPTS